MDKNMIVVYNLLKWIFLRMRHFTDLYAASAFCLLHSSIIHFTILLVLAIDHSSRLLKPRWQSSSGLGKTL